MSTPIANANNENAHFSNCKVTDISYFTALQTWSEIENIFAKFNIAVKLFNKHEKYLPQCLNQTVMNKHMFVILALL